MNILFVGVNFAPEHTGIAPYTTEAAKYLVDAGHDVEVFTGLPHYPAWAVPDGYESGWSFRETLHGVDVLRAKHYVPTSQSAVRRGLYEATFAGNLFARSATRRPDVVVAVVPTLLSAVSALAIARKAKARLVVWIQDSMARAATQSGIKGGSGVASLVGRVEGGILRAADAAMVISEPFAAHVQGYGVHRNKIHLIRNWAHIEPPRLSRADTRFLLGWGADELIALHTGNMGLKQGLENIVSAAALPQAEAVPLNFVLMGDGSQREALVAASTANPRVRIQAPVGRELYSSALAAADVLLVNERGSVRDMSLPSKLTSYLSAGRPIVAAASAEGATAREVRRSEAGVVVAPDCPQDLLAAVRSMTADKARADVMGRRGREYAEEHLSAGRSLDRLQSILTGEAQSWKHRELTALR